MSPFKFQVKVYHEDIDRGGVVYYANSGTRLDDLLSVTVKMMQKKKTHLWCMNTA